MAITKFIPTTVLEPTFTKLAKNEDGKWVKAGLAFVLDSLKVSSITEEGPEKTARGGLNNRVFARYGKTARLEMEDAIGRREVLQHLMAAEIVADKGSGLADKDEWETELEEGSDKIILDLEIPESGTQLVVYYLSGTTWTQFTEYDLIDNKIIKFDSAEATVRKFKVSYKPYKTYKIHVTDAFPGRYTIKGKTFVLQGGEQKWMDFNIHTFIPDGLLNLTMEAEGDFGVFEIGGEVVSKCGEFYTITESDFNPCP